MNNELLLLLLLLHFRNSINYIYTESPTPKSLHGCIIRFPRTLIFSIFLLLRFFSSPFFFFVVQTLEALEPAALTWYQSLTIVHLHCGPHYSTFVNSECAC